MVIQNSEVSMASKSSVTRGMNLTIQSERKPIVNMENVQILGGQDDFLSSLNYARSPSGSVQEVDNTNPLMNSAANRKVKLHTMEYLFRMLVMGMWWNDDSKFGEYLKNNFGETDSIDSSGMSNTYTGMEPVFVETTDISYSYWENQSVEYSSTGTAITADGRKLNFEYSFAMSDTFMQELNISHSAIRSCVDPLVINLDDCPTMLAPQKFFFDLNGDGTEEEINNLATGSGFLALDKNEDGVINDGIELFGAKSGDGFGELSLFDEDGNGWIDEADSIYAKLRIMTINEKGEQELYGLKESDVGAIYLGHIGTGFVHRDDDGNVSGVTRQSGMYLHEKDGRAGGVQHVDFAT